MRLELKDITKRFPGVLANDRISISVDRGEVLGLLGENGAGKTTLMNILSGLYRPDSGEILIDGEGPNVRGSTAGDPCRHRHGPPALPAGARCSTSSNRSRSARRASSGPLGTFDREVARQKVVELSKQYGLNVEPGRHHRRPARRRPPARRDPQGALSRQRHPRPGRAVGGAHAGRDGGALHDHPRAGRKGDLGHLHHAQAGRGAGGRGPDHGPAPRRRRRHGGPQGHQPRAPGPADGRARRRPHRRQVAGDARARSS